MRILFRAAFTHFTGLTTVLTGERELCKCRRIVSAGLCYLQVRIIRTETCHFFESPYHVLCYGFPYCSHCCRLCWYLGMHFFCLLFQHSVRFEQDVFPLYDCAWFHCKRNEGSNVDRLLCVVFYVCVATEIFDVMLCSLKVTGIKEGALKRRMSVRWSGPQFASPMV